MSHIAVIGGNGYTGAAVVAEALRRGHAVTSLSRSRPDAALAGVRYVTGSALDPAALDDALAGADAVVAAVTSRGEASQAAPRVAEALVERAAQTGVRVLVVGGFSSLRPAPGAARIIDGGVPEQYRVEAQAGHAALEALLASPASVDWVFFSPAASYGSWIPGSPSGAYRLGGDVAMLDETGSSVLYAEDLALAVLDVIDSGEHSREHVSVVSGA